LTLFVFGFNYFAIGFITYFVRLLLILSFAFSIHTCHFTVSPVSPSIFPFHFHFRPRLNLTLLYSVA